MFNFITHIQSCSELIKQTVPINLVLYSHIPTSALALFIGIFVLLKAKRTLLSKILFLISLTFSLWSLCDLVTWVSTNSMLTMFSWSLFLLLNTLIYMFSMYFSYVFATGKDLTVKAKSFLFALLLPALAITPTIYNLKYFDIPSCEAKENSYLDWYYYTVGAIFIIAILCVIIKNYRKNKQQILLMGFGLEFFLVLFLSLNLVSSILGNYNFEYYGLFGIVVFIAFLSYLIVKFKTFDIKLLGAQALVWSFVILIGSQFFYLDQTSNISLIVITAVTLVISAVIGLLLVRGVKREISLRESLQVANNGQTNLIHIMNHQIKGHLGVAKNIFAELLDGDYGQIPESAKSVVEKGLTETDSGVKYVTEILKGASAENGTLPYDMKQIDFKMLLLKVVQGEKELAKKDGLSLDLKIDDGTYTMMGDVIQLSEAVINLIDNSIYYTPSGNISVHLIRRGGKIILAIKDTGVGIKEEDRPKLFKSGGVGIDSIKINIRSSGYGLAFVKGVVEAHKGKVWFESEGEGKGSTFFMEFPTR